MEKKFLDKQGLAEVSQSFDNKYANKNDVPTKLSQLEEDDTHKVVTQEKKDNWDKKLDENSDISKNQVTYNYTGVMPKVGNRSYKIKDYGNTTDTLGRVLSDQCEEIAKLACAKQGAELVATLDDNKKIPLNQLPDEALKNTSPATFVIANYDSSENSKTGADYVIQENESPCDVINSFIEKLPEYGGKIQLTEGNFVEKGQKTILIDDAHKCVSIAGYGKSTLLTKNSTDGNGIFIRIEGEYNTIRDLHIDDSSQASVYISSNGNYSHIQDCVVLARGGVGVIISADNCIVSNCLVASGTSAAILVGASQVKVTNCHAETFLDNEMGCIQLHNVANHCVISNCSVSAKNATGIEVLGDNNSIIGCYASSDKFYTFSIAGNHSVVSGCVGESKDGTTFFMTGVGNRLVDCTAHATGKQSKSVAFSTGSTSRHCSLESCFGTSETKLTFGIFGQNHALTNCVAEPKKSYGFALSGSGHTLTSCSSLDGVDFGIISRANGVVITNCVVTNKVGVNLSPICLDGVSRKNWCVGARVYGGNVKDNGTSNIVERTVELPPPIKKES